MIILRQLGFSRTSKEDKYKIVGGTMIAAGGIGLPKSIKKLKKGIKSSEGELTGRLRRYHNTKSENVDSILKEGLEGKRTLDPDSYANKMLEGLATKDKRPLVYTTTDKEVADQVGTARWLNGHAKNEGKTLELHIPYDNVKNRRVTDNPEQLGLDLDGYVKEMSKKQRKTLEKMGFLSEEEIAQALTNHQMTHMQNYRLIDAKKGPTRIYEGDISPEFIKDSKKYKKLSFKEWKNYIKNNPKRFGKAAKEFVLPVAGATALIGAGAYAYGKGSRNS